MGIEDGIVVGTTVGLMKALHWALSSVSMSDLHWVLKTVLQWALKSELKTALRRVSQWV